MPIKDYFSRKGSIISSSSLESLGGEIETYEFIKSYDKESNRIIPPLDFSNISNFCKFGSAQKYYDDSIKRIYNNYPYDGSLREKTEFINSSSYLEKYILEKEYPRSTGYAILSAVSWGTNVGSSSLGFGLPSSVEYIQISGTMNLGPNMDKEGANIYSINENRTYNLKLDGDSGNTVEFWLKKTPLSTTLTSKEVVFDLWNGEVPAFSTSSSYGRYTIILDNTTSSVGSCIKLTYVSGNVSTCSEYAIGDTEATLSSIMDNNWHHIAISTKNTSSDLSIKLFVDGQLKKSHILSSAAMGEISGPLVANIGCLRTKSSPTDNSSIGYGKLSASIDDFRFWKKERNSKQIGTNWYTEVGGGMNVEDFSANLGVYYKFNEGITLTSSIDRVVLDYSGRISNGSWVGYSSNSRNTGSAINEYSSNFNEPGDLIIYEQNPLVINYYNKKIQDGYEYDINNNSSLYYSIPSWIIEENNDQEKNHLLYLTQIMSSYFDELYANINSLQFLKTKNYFSSSIRPVSYSRNLLLSNGFYIDELFSNTTLLEEFLSKDEERTFEDKLYIVKNTIYQNIYNNLSYIFKTKGTKESLRNLIRCFGIDEGIIKINLYANNNTINIEDSTTSYTKKKKCIEFNRVDNFNATVFQTASSEQVSVAYLSSSSNSYEASGSSFTSEAGIFFPKKLEYDSPVFFETPFVTASLFGIHRVNEDGISWNPLDNANFQVFFVRDRLESKNGYFMMTGTAGGFVGQLTSSVYQSVYNNEKWNLFVRFRPNMFPYGNSVSGAISSNCFVEFGGVNTVSDTIKEQFCVSQSISLQSYNNFVSSNKKFFVGAHRQNFTGSVLQQTDVRIFSARVWDTYLSNDDIITHSKIVDNFGISNLNTNDVLLNTTLKNNNITRDKSLSLNWDFEDVTGSNGNGEFFVYDKSSGSFSETTQNGWYTQKTRALHHGSGYGFLSGDASVVENEYLFSCKKTLPEEIKDNELVSVLTKDDETFTRNTAPIKYFYSIEKNMYQIISEEIIKSFSSIVDFSNFIGDPVNRYRINYKALTSFKRRYFNKIENVPDINKFINYYKWIDGSVLSALYQVIPASSDVEGGMQNVIENHILERNKYWNKFPTLEFKVSDPESGTKGINELTYDWKTGHKPLTNEQSSNCFYWKQRESRTSSVLRTGVAAVDAARNYILTASFSSLQRSFSIPNKIDFEYNLVIGDKNKNASKSLILPKLKYGTVSSNSIVIPGTSINNTIICNDDLELNNNKNQTNFTSKNIVNTQDYLNRTGKDSVHFSIFSSSIQSGYINPVSSAVGRAIDFTNMHEDEYDNINGIMQGPFTFDVVGGLQHRHVAINSGTISAQTRPEAYKIIFSSSNVYICPPEAKSPSSYDSSIPRASFYRDEMAKRSINIKNISQKTYFNDYTVVQTSGKILNNKEFVMSGGFGHMSASSYFFGMVDYPKLIRQKYKHCIMERFSSPGGPESSGDANGGIGLDYYASEYSIYSTVNYRNPLLRNGLNTLYTYNCGRFGFDTRINPQTSSANYSGYASFHKTHRNTGYRMALTTSIETYSPSNYYTKSINDNYYVQHQIPQGEIYTQWMLSSVFFSGSGYHT